MSSIPESFLYPPFSLLTLLSPCEKKKYNLKSFHDFFDGRRVLSLKI